MFKNYHAKAVKFGHSIEIQNKSLLLFEQLKILMTKKTFQFIGVSATLPVHQLSFHINYARPRSRNTKQITLAFSESPSSVIIFTIQFREEAAPKYKTTKHAVVPPTSQKLNFTYCQKTHPNSFAFQPFSKFSNYHSMSIQLSPVVEIHN